LLTEDPYPGQKLLFTGDKRKLHLPPCKGVRGGSAHLVGFSVWFQPLASSFRVPQPIGQSIVPSLYTGEARGVPVSNNEGGDGVSEWRGATSFTDSLLHDTGV
jgi:hypothetical protein